MSLAPAAHIQESSASARKAQQPAGSSTPPHERNVDSDAGKTESKFKKRTLFGFGKKKPDDTAMASPAKTPSKESKAEESLPSPPSTALAKDASRIPSRRSTGASSTRFETPLMKPTSPGRAFRSSTPRLASPAGSQIFERDVQESIVLPNSPAIPSHIQVEDHIPPALDASSQAITDGHLNPDSVEIVTHASHQPASVAVTGAGPFDAAPSWWVDELASLADKEEAASNYGSLDSADVRRLSFISFADVVQAEHGTQGGAGSRDSIALAGLTSLSSTGINRSPSPIRSPISSQGVETSPPTSKSGSIRGLDMSPSRKSIGSPSSTQYNLAHNNSGDLNIETMSQALRRTGSSDLSAARSLSFSPLEEMSR